MAVPFGDAGAARRASRNVGRTGSPECSEDAIASVTVGGNKGLRLWASARWIDSTTSKNQKGVCRLYKEEGLTMGKSPPTRRVAWAKREVMPTATQKNDRWSMDFMSDQLFDGRRFCLPTFVDNSTVEAVGDACGRPDQGHRGRGAWLPVNDSLTETVGGTVPPRWYFIARRRVHDHAIMST